MDKLVGGMGWDILCAGCRCDGMVLRFGVDGMGCDWWSGAVDTAQPIAATMVMVFEGVMEMPYSGRNIRVVLLLMRLFYF